MDTYMQLLNTPGSYLSGQAEQQQRTFQQTAQQCMEQAQQQQQAFQQMTQEWRWGQYSLASATSTMRVCGPPPEAADASRDE
jgi:hypothetical protein